jgi:AraC-like DNA-binding protein
VPPLEFCWYRDEVEFMGAVILNERARRFEADAENPWLSLKCMLRGSARYSANRREYAVGHGHCLLLNEGTPYSIAIESTEVVESFVVFFQPEWVAAMLRAHVESIDDLLDEPFRDSDGGFHFQETLYPLDGGLEHAHRELRRHHASGQDNPTLREELADELLAACVRRQASIVQESRRLDRQRRATRLELHRRLQIARDFLLSNYSSRVSLDQLARVACLSRFHFSREFKALYGFAPMIFLENVRMRRATELLQTSAKSVLEVCLEVGFESPTTFSTRIRRRTGLSPRALRNFRN